MATGLKLVIVTASTDPERAYPCLKTWGTANGFIGVVNGRAWEPKTKPAEQAGELSREWLLVPEYLGSVAAFRLGVDFALKETDADIIACFHDDLEIHDPDWVRTVTRHFERHPECGLAGFGGALGLGASDIYKTPYNPMQLARFHFRSNLVNAEVHGMRSLVPERVSALDGFAQIGRREFWWGVHAGQYPPWHEMSRQLEKEFPRTFERPWTVLENLGLKHHLYDSLLGAIAARYGWETWYLPVRCRHLGGQTAVGDQGYQAWAKTQTDGIGDHAFWVKAHQVGYEAFRDVLPLRV